MKPAEMFVHWDQVRADLLAIIDKFDQEELTFTPFVGAWPVGQIMLHIAECEDYWLHQLVRPQSGLPLTYALADHPTREEIKAMLGTARNRTLAFLASLDVADLNKEYTTPNGEVFTIGWTIWHVLEHEIHHRGELSLILGLLGHGGLEV